MPIPFQSPVDLNRNEILNVRFQNLATPPSHAAGIGYFDTNLGYFRVSNGTSWVDLAPGSLDTEAVMDVVASMVEGTEIIGTYDDTAGTITFELGEGVIGNVHIAADAAIAMSKIDGLGTALSGKSNTGHSHVVGDVTGLQGELDGKSDTGHAHVVGDVTGLQGELDGKSDTGHAHVVGDVTGLQGALDGKSDTGHSHVTGDITGLDTALSDKADTDHDHAIADVTGLQGALDGKSATGHTHTASNITDFQATVSGNTDVAANTAARHTHSNQGVLDATTASFTTADETKLDGLSQYTDADAMDIRLDQFAAPTASVSFNSQKITAVATPTVGTDAANKDYVDNLAQGLDPKASVRAATTGAITLSGTQTIDGVAVVAGNRVLVKNQGDAATNGIYVVAADAWARAEDFNSNAEASPGAFTFVEEGTDNGNTGWVHTTDGPIVLGTTGLTFAQFSSAGTYVGGAGLTLTGTTFAVGAGTGITVNADDVAIDTSVVVRKYAQNIGNGAATTIVITHGLGTRDIDFSVRDATTHEFVMVNGVASADNTLTLYFGTAPATNAYRVVVHG